MPQAEKARKILSWAAVRGARRWSREQGEWVISEWQRSGQSVQDFAAQHGIDPQRVYFWSKRSKPQHKGKRGSQGRPEIVELKLAPSPLSMERRVEIQLVSGRRLSVAEHIDLDVLERFVAVLER
jgi:transposase-like protein